jgi:hypothetical protein
MTSIAASASRSIAFDIRREPLFRHGRAGIFSHLPSRRVSHPARGCCADRRSRNGGANRTASSDRARFTCKTPHQPGFLCLPSGTKPGTKPFLFPRQKWLKPWYFSIGQKNREIEFISLQRGVSELSVPLEMNRVCRGRVEAPGPKGRARGPLLCLPPAD